MIQILKLPSIKHLKNPQLHRDVALANDGQDVAARGVMEHKTAILYAEKTDIINNSGFPLDRE